MAQDHESPFHICRDKESTIDIPILGSAAHKPSELLIVAQCPECGFPVFAHAATPTQETVAFPTCDHVEGVSAIDIPTYDPERERQTMHVLFSLIYNIRSIAVEYSLRFGGLDDEETVVDVDSKLVA